MKHKHRRTGRNGNAHGKEIRFYRANQKPYGFLSNLYRRPILFEGQHFLTAEHAYQAGKPRKESVRKWLMSAPAPSLVAMAAHGLYTWDIRSDWAKIKFDRMRSVLRSKFTQHDDLRALLLSTGEARLVEWTNVDNPVNRTWGEVNGKGQNMLGIFLMELRAELKGKNSIDTDKVKPAKAGRSVGSERPKIPRRKRLGRQNK